jgi:hypothetical protein
MSRRGPRPAGVTTGSAVGGDACRYRPPYVGYARPERATWIPQVCAVGPMYDGGGTRKIE